MKVILIIIGFLLVSGLVFYITTNQNKLASNKKEKYNESEIKKVNQKEFEAIRNKRLSTKPSDLNITLPNKKKQYLRCNIRLGNWRSYLYYCCFH